MPSLPLPPSQLTDATGTPLFGRYAGRISTLDWSNLAANDRIPTLQRFLRHKRWQYLALSSEQLFCAVAIIDLGWICAAFAYVFERRQKKILVDWSAEGLPGLQARVGTQSYFRSLREYVGIEQTQSGYTLKLKCANLHIAAQITRPLHVQDLLAVGEIAGGSVHATQKTTGMPATATIQIGSRTYAAQSMIASLDCSNGFLERETAWRWASAHNLDLGFNLQKGYFGQAENALWLDGEIHALGAAQFHYDAADPLSPWHIATEDGLLELVFEPEGYRRQDKDLWIAASRYVQAIGRFSGWVKPDVNAPARRVENLVGVTEDHHSRW